MTNRLGLRASRRSGRRPGVLAGRARIGEVLIGCIALGWVLHSGTVWAAGEKPHELVWAHASPASVSRFVVFISAVKGNQTGARLVDVGKPAGEPSNTMQIFSAIVPIEATEYVAVAAVGYDGRMGQLSQWSAVPPSRPGQPIVVP